MGEPYGRTSSGTATAFRGPPHRPSWNRKDEKTWHAVISGGLGWMEISRERLNLVKYVSYRVRHARQPPFILGSGPAEKPWSRIFIDHAGPFMGQFILIVIDAYRIEVYPTSSTGSTSTIEKLRQAFANHGLPEMVV